MVTRQCCHMPSTFAAKDSSTITNVCHMAELANDKNHNSARATALYDIVDPINWIKLLAKLKKSCLSSAETTPNSFLWLPRESILLDHEMMQVVSQKLSARCSPMTIVNSKK